MVESIYNDDGSSVTYVVSPLFKEPKIIRCSEWDNWVIDQIVRDYERSGKAYVPLRPHEIAEIFPQSKPYLNQKKRDLTERLGVILEEERALNADEELRKHKNKDLKEAMERVIESKRQSILEQKQEADTILGFLNPRKSKAIQNFQLELQKAKTYPIDKLLPFTRRKTQCLWHTDKDPSLYHYKKDNRVHCFVCEKGGDSVDVVMQQQGCSIAEAIAFLNRA